MNSTDKIMEAVEYASNQTKWEDWWQTFENKLEAKSILRAAKKESCDESEKVCLIEMMNIDIEFDEDTVDSVYFKALDKLKKALDQYEE